MLIKAYFGLWFKLIVKMSYTYYVNDLDKKYSSESSKGSLKMSVLLNK